ncbi:MAG: 3-deoxy-7-phosphoheptulonate synthase [Nanoarchaeota archaeon]
MDEKNLTDKNISSYEPLQPPQEIKAKFPAPSSSAEKVNSYRKAISDIINKIDKRKLFIVGPCSIHNPDEAIDYAKRLKKHADRVNDKIVIAMRLYFEKPRTIGGWRGLINDPYLDGTDNSNAGYAIARKLMLDITEIGVPIATELLDPITPQYIDDLISWAAIGARTTESPKHRHMVSGLSIPTGFKNETSGTFQTAIHAILAAREQHTFVGIDQKGTTCMIRTKGNSDTHIILRGGSNGTNYGRDSLEEVKKGLDTNNISTSIIVDCSHANSQKNHKNQARVLRDVVESMNNGFNYVAGVMIESNIMKVIRRSRMI